MAVLRQVTTLSSMTVNNCAPLNKAPVSKHPTRMMLMGTTASAKNLKALSGRGNNQTGKLASGLELALHRHPRMILLLPSVLTLCHYYLTTSCNSFHGFLKVLYSIACLIFHQQYARREMREQLAA
ncbi:hypothetical protein BDV19DRAFT_395572 [Aspergillus venezuelensis]